MTRHRSNQRGLSMIELMAGAAIGLFIAAAGGTLLVGQLRESRMLVLDTRLTQELRTAVDLIARDLRRAGYSGDAVTGPNPYAYTAPATTTDTLSVRYALHPTDSDRVDASEQFGYRLHGGAIEMQLGAGSWQAVTDANVITVTGFNVTPQITETAIAADCPARLQARSVVITISAAAANDARIARRVQGTAHVRADALVAACPI